jgi:hypothetical protein
MSRAPACSALSITARFSTWVTPVGTPMSMRGLMSPAAARTWLMNSRIMMRVRSKSAITPSFKGRLARMEGLVRPRYCLAWPPTATGLPVSRWMATTEGSLSTTPLPLM